MLTSIPIADSPAKLEIHMEQGLSRRPAYRGGKRTIQPQLRKTDVSAVRTCSHHSFLFLQHRGTTSMSIDLLLAVDNT